MNPFCPKRHASFPVNFSTLLVALMKSAKRISFVRAAAGSDLSANAKANPKGLVLFVVLPKKMPNRERLVATKST